MNTFESRLEILIPRAHAHTVSPMETVTYVGSTIVNAWEYAGFKSDIEWMIEVHGVDLRRISCSVCGYRATFDGRGYTGRCQRCIDKAYWDPVKYTGLPDLATYDRVMEDK